MRDRRIPVVHDLDFYYHSFILAQISPIGYIKLGMRVDLYETPSGQSPVEKYIESLPKADQARFAEVLLGLEEQGLAYSRAQFRQLRGKLWEVKFSAPSGGHRMAYVLLAADYIVILHAFRKSTQKTPLHDLDLAEKRMKEVLGL